MNEKNIQEVHASKRDWPPIPGKTVDGKLSAHRLLLTYLGTLFTLSGFICQNIGTRELHWSAGVLQLGATLLLVMLRAWLRRHVGDVPRPIPVSLSEGIEASQIAVALEESSFSMIFDYFERLSPEKREQIELLFPMKLQVSGSSFGINEHHSPEFRVDHSIEKIVRLIATSKELSELYPIDNATLELASAVSRAMYSILELINKVRHKDDHRIFEWTHYVILKELDSEQSLPEIITLRFCMQESPTELDIGILQNIIEMLINFSCNEKDYKLGRLFREFHMLGHCTREQFEARKRQLNSWKIGTVPGSLCWSSTAEGQNQKPKDGEEKIASFLLGLKYGSLFQDR